MDITRSASRTLIGRYLPLLCGVVTTILVIFAAEHVNDDRWMGLDIPERIAVVGIGILATVAIEMSILRQIKLINGGHVTEAIVDDVQTMSWSDEHATAHYHFFTQDGRVITSRCVVPHDEVEMWQRGRKITAIYDPVRPARHAIDERLWAVEWEVEKKAA